VTPYFDIKRHLGTPEANLDVFSPFCHIRFGHFLEKRLRETMDFLYGECFLSTKKRSGRVLQRLFTASSMYVTCFLDMGTYLHKK
jgi:hypothetical protein